MGRTGSNNRPPDDLQIWQAKRILEGLVELPRKATRLLRTGAGFEDNRTISGRWREVMALFLNSAVTLKARENELRNPPLCEELRVRDILDNLVVTTNGAFVAAYELSGIYSQYHEDETRNRTKESL